MNWYYVENGQQAGPVDDTRLQELVASGAIQPDTLVWHEGLANWQPYRALSASGTGSPEPGAAPASATVAASTAARVPPTKRSVWNATASSANKT
jgi:hypothetical protein